MRILDIILLDIVRILFHRIVRFQHNQEKNYTPNLDIVVIYFQHVPVDQIRIRRGAFIYQAPLDPPLTGGQEQKIEKRVSHRVRIQFFLLRRVQA